MNIINISENITKDLTEGKWEFRLRLKDIFRNFQDQKIDLKHAKAQIASRIAKFVKENPLGDNVKSTLMKLKAKITGEEDAIEIDDLVNSLYDIADDNSILVK